MIDYDGVHQRFYAPIDLDHPDVLIRDGLPPTETDPRFHQQMVYAVMAGLWADFETALGRRVTLGRKQFLTVFPHAFYGQNAYYDPDTSSLLFGYYRADATDVGTNLPGQMVYTCLSHDIIAHETTHSLVDRLRPEFMINSNPDVPAFHEGFADLVAIFQHFKMNEVLEPALADSRGELSRSEALLGLARQFGYSTGTKAPLRTARDDDPDPTRYRSSEEPHERGAVLVRAVFDAFISMYNQRTQDLVRLASDGSGVLREGALHPDLVNRLAREASALANTFFTALIRAFDYLPPLDVTFEDFLRSLVTVDFTLSPSDESLRVALIEGFRRHGIYPTTAGSLGDEAVAWGPATKPITGFPFEASLLADVIRDLDDVDPEGFEVDPKGFDDNDRRGLDQMYGEAAPSPGPWRDWAVHLYDFAKAHPDELQLDPDAHLCVTGMHPTIRYRANGRPTVDLVVRYLQERPDLATATGFVPRGGCTVVAGGDGVVRYVIAKRLPAQNPAVDAKLPPAQLADARSRLAGLGRQLVETRLHDPGDAYRHLEPDQQLRIRFALLHSAHERGEDQ